MLIVMPYIDALDLSQQTLADALAQTDCGPVRVLLIDQGSSQAGWDWGDRMAAEHEGQVLCWHYHPQVSLGRAWNMGMAFAEECGEEGALIINNDLRLLSPTAAILRNVAQQREAYFVSGVGVDGDRWGDGTHVDAESLLKDRGGPDFSCYYLTLAGWHAYRFDENYFPAYCEDLDLHRRMLLGGDGARIFGIELPFRHFASGTINQSSEHRRRLTKLFEQSRAYYAEKWGGPANEETYWQPGGGSPIQGWTPPEWAPTTPALFTFIQEHRAEDLQALLTPEADEYTITHFDPVTGKETRP